MLFYGYLVESFSPDDTVDQMVVQVIQLNWSAPAKIISPFNTSYTGKVSVISTALPYT